VPGAPQPARGRQPHRALWDTVAVALLLPLLTRLSTGDGESAADFLAAASVPVTVLSAAADKQQSLFD
jgi:amino acid transporter